MNSTNGYNDLNNLNLDTRFQKLILKFCNFLRENYDFKISTDTLLQFFKFQNSLDLFNKDEMRMSLKALLCKNKDQFDIFDEVYEDFFCNRIRFVEDNKESKENNSIAQLAIDKANENFKKNNSFNRSSTKEESKLEKVYRENKSTIKDMIDNLGLDISTSRNLKNLLSFNHEELITSFQQSNNPDKMEANLKNGLNELMTEVLLDDNSPDGLTDLILTCVDTVDDNRAFSDKLNLEKEKQLKHAQVQIEKLQSLNNRVEFIGGTRAVKNHLDIANNEITKLTDEDYVKLSNYIKVNASKFKTRIGRSMKKNKAKKFDYATTLRKSVKTGGTPMELCFKKPHIKKTRIVCILDISGSCIKPAKMFMNFIYELSSVFKGGVKTFVFVKDIANVTDLFKTHTTIEATEKALVAVPNKGCYSDYNYAFEKFDNEFIGNIDKDTIVIYLGDARNNKNASGIEFVQRIKEKCNSMIWLNHEPKEDWDTGDSIMSTYSKLMDEVYSIQRVNDLIDFLNNFKIA